MGSYVNRRLIEDETVLYEAHYHWSVWLAPSLWVALSVALLVAAWVFQPQAGNGPVYASLILLFFSLCYLLNWYLKRGFDEFVVTNQRVITKRGIFSHKTTEQNLKKIETVSVEQSLVERLLGRGTLIFSGTGSTTTVLYKMASPHTFRKALQQAMSDYGHPDEPAPAAPASSAAPLSRVEQLERLERLRSNGTLTEEEFLGEKRRILERLES